MAADIFFSPNGAIEGVNEGNGKAYYNNQEVPFLNSDQLIHYAAAIYSEAAGSAMVQQLVGSNFEYEMLRESFGMAQTMFNYVIAKNQALQRSGRSYGLNELLTDTSYMYGINSPAYKQYFENGGDALRKNCANLAVIKLFTKNTSDMSDIVSSGSLFWDGKDLFNNTNHYRVQKGFQLADENFGTLYSRAGLAPTISTTQATDPAALFGPYTYLSVFVAGGSIFHSFHPDAYAKGVSV